MQLFLFVCYRNSLFCIVYAAIACVILINTLLIGFCCLTVVFPLYSPFLVLATKTESLRQFSWWNKLDLNETPKNEQNEPNNWGDICGTKCHESLLLCLRLITELRVSKQRSGGGESLAGALQSSDTNGFARPVTTIVCPPSSSSSFLFSHPFYQWRLHWCCLWEKSPAVQFPQFVAATAAPSCTEQSGGDIREETVRDVA